MNDAVQAQLDAARNRLLDLTLRNRLLNFRPTRRTTIQIVDEIPAEIWKLLVAQRRALSFLAREEHEMYRRPRPEGEQPAPGDTAPDEPQATDASDGELFALPDLVTGLDAEDGALPERYTDRFLQTPLPGEELQTNLLRTYQAANSAPERSRIATCPSA